MEKLIPFVTNHWPLVTAFVVVMILFMMHEVKQKLAAGQLFEPFQVVNQMNREDAVVLDIRSKDKFDQGHILNAIHTKTSEIEQLNKYKNKPIIVVCDAGVSAKGFSTKLKRAGFENVAVLRGGMQSWVQAELPTTQQVKSSHEKC